MVLSVISRMFTVKSWMLGRLIYFVSQLNYSQWIFRGSNSFLRKKRECFSEFSSFFEREFWIISTWNWHLFRIIRLGRSVICLENILVSDWIYFSSIWREIGILILIYSAETSSKCTKSTSKFAYFTPETLIPILLEICSIFSWILAIIIF